LRAEGHDVVGLDVAPGADTGILGSVADRALIDRTFAEQGIEAVIHSGALHKPDIVRYPRRAFVDVNVTGTLNLLEAAAAAGHDRFVFTSTTSLMVTEALHSGRVGRTEWMTEDYGPLEPRNVYGITKLAAEKLCRLVHREQGLPVCILRTSRFFPEEDDTHRAASGPNVKANEFLNRRLTVEDAAEAHVAALARAPELGFGTFIVSAPPPFSPEDCEALAVDPEAVVERHFPQVRGLYSAAGWTLPTTIDRVYDPSAAEARLGFRCRTDFGSVLEALAAGGPLPFAHDPHYVSPKEGAPR
ncbi:MAG TPA: NAD(P)-dependent oxidoreductase, partial [Allosphingosinicella sp.]|nr:NAD(P)-dependent oxidoreductase [Allosphingosinicella sp.]